MTAMIQVVGPSGAGKTRALEEAIRLLRARGLRVAVLKHSHHPLDLAGKDTDRLRASGAEAVLFASEASVLFSDWDPVVLAGILPVDVVLVEGFHRRRFPGRRFAVRAPGAAAAIAVRIDRAVPSPPARVALTGDGRPLPDDGLWGLVGNLMRETGLCRVERAGSPRNPDPSPRPPSPRRTRPG
jgi:molybdopterin-guanine dinucleotide biosynthesis protein B